MYSKGGDNMGLCGLSLIGLIHKLRCYIKDRIKWNTFINVDIK